MTARTRRRPVAARRDAYAEVTARIIAALERGTVPWRHPWRARGLRNAVSHRPYRGINLLVLSLTSMEAGYDDARWLTFRQAEQLGGHVRRGEHGTRVIFWKWPARDEERDADSDDERRGGDVPLMRLYTVFNVAQCEGLALPDPESGGEFDPLERAESIVSGYSDGPAVCHDAEAAYYVPSRDEVHLPPRGAFRDADGYYATLFHELAHSTGHRSRLDREGYQESALFGSPVYSREELVAEFAAAFLCQEASIDASRLDQSAAYIASWLRALQDDRRLAVAAAGQAQRAVDHILGRDPQAPVTPINEEEHADV